jgi:AraC-like DNA-binding protein
MEHRAVGAVEPVTPASYREFAPHPSLRHVVRALFSFTSRPDPNPTRGVMFEMRCDGGYPRCLPMFADGSASIVLDAGEVFFPDGTWRDSPGPPAGRFIGAMSHVTPSALHGMPGTVGAYFHATQLPSVAHLPSSELTDHVVVVEDVWRNLVGLSETIPALGENARLDALETALMRRVSAGRDRFSPVDVRGLAALVARRRGNISVESLAGHAGITRQQLTRLFRDRVGVTPKTYCRLARFHSALAYVRPADRPIEWSRLACELGYADQSHMIAEFRQFSSLTPQMLATQAWFHPFIERARAAIR